MLGYYELNGNCGQMYKNQNIDGEICRFEWRKKK
jgi:hypothetical protein